MSFKKLLDAIEAGETGVAKELATSIEADFNANVKEIDKLETKASEAISGRDKVKAKMRELSEGLGVDELTVDGLKALTKSKGNDSEVEAKYKVQLDDLSKKLADMESDYNGKLTEAQSRYQDAVIDKELLKLGASANVADGAIEDVVNYLKANVAIEDGNIVYKADGVPERNSNGRPTSLSDKMEQLRETRSYLFKANTQQGSGEPHRPAGGGNAKTINRSSFDGMEPQAQASFVKGGGTVTE